MQTITWKSALPIALPSVGLALLMQACGGGGDANAQTVAEPDPIQGLWQSSVTLSNCDSGAALGSFRGLTSFSQGGTAIADNNQPSPTKGPAMGYWTRNATGAYTVTLRFWRYAADGTPSGQQRLTRTVTLAADGKTLTSTIVTQALDTSDAVVQQACGAETGAKIG